MKKLLGLLTVLALILTAAAVVGEGAEDARITGKFEDGAYVLTVKTDPDDAGEWRADEMAQDDTVVKLAYSGLENGVFTARYEPAGDGEICLNLRHFNAHDCCDMLHSFVLLVKDGKAQEVTGGSWTVSPDEGELDPLFSGEWQEKDTQFTVLDVMKKAGDGWDVEIISPMSHGAWVIRASAYYDCDYDGFIYTDGVKYDLVPEGTPKETGTGLSGILRFTGTGEDALLTWCDWESGSEETVFERAPELPADGGSSEGAAAEALPAYGYTGDDPLEGAVAEALAAGEYAERFLTEPGYASIPCPIIHRTETTDETHAKVYGTFWVLNYVKSGDTLKCISGGEYPGIALLEKNGGEWRMTSLEEAGDGEDYTADIRRFAGGDRELEEKYFAAADLLEKSNQEIRTRFVRAYAEANGLAVTAYQDYGWDPVPLK